MVSAAVRILPMGEHALLLEVDTLQDATDLHRRLDGARPDGVVDLVPAARTVLVRAVGPSLGALGVEGVMPDPKLELFDNDNGGKKIGENDNWGGDEQIVNVARSVGAFALAGNDTKDAVLLMTLPAGAYSARLSGVGGAGGTAIVEVYEVP